MQCLLGDFLTNSPHQAAKEIDPGYIEAQSVLSTILLSGSIVGLILTVSLITPGRD